MEEKQKKPLRSERKNIEEMSGINKMSYEEQGRAIVELKQQLNMVIQKYRERDMENFYKRLDFDFEVIRCSEDFIERGYKDFVDARVAEIVTMMTPQEQPKETSATDCAKPEETNDTVGDTMGSD